MTHTSLNRWIKASEFRHGTPGSSGMRACLHAAVNTMQSGFKAVVADRHLSELYGFAKRASHRYAPVGNNIGGDRLAADQGPTPLATAVFGPQSAKILGSALMVIAGVVALDLFILWVAAGRVIDHLPL